MGKLIKLTILLIAAAAGAALYNYYKAVDNLTDGTFAKEGLKRYEPTSTPNRDSIGNVGGIGRVGGVGKVNRQRNNRQGGGMAW